MTHEELMAVVEDLIIQTTKLADRVHELEQQSQQQEWELRRGLRELRVDLENDMCNLQRSHVD